MIGLDKKQSDDDHSEECAEEVSNNIVRIKKTGLLLVVKLFADAYENRNDESKRDGGRPHPECGYRINDQGQHKADREVNVLVLPNGSKNV